MARRTHACLSGCGTRISVDRIACPTCWRRLPQTIRSNLARNRRTGTASHALATHEASEWFINNPAPRRRRPS